MLQISINVSSLHPQLSERQEVGSRACDLEEQQPATDGRSAGEHRQRGRVEAAAAPVPRGSGARQALRR